jgi:rubrerythrin
VPPMLLEGHRWRRVREHRRRVRLGLCLVCGYDLRHSPEQCPECGAVPAAKGEQA